MEGDRISPLKSNEYDVIIIIIIIIIIMQHKAAGMKIKLSKNNDHDGILLGVKSA